jgi:hypothetical protein
LHASSPGRGCPAACDYAPSVFSGPVDLPTEVLSLMGALVAAGSDAALSYGRRIVDGPEFSIDDAFGRAIAPGCAALVA